MRAVVAFVAVLALATSAGATSGRVTIAVTPKVMGQGEVVHLSGTVDGAGEAIKIDMRECRALRFHQVEGTRSGLDGSWAKDTRWAFGNTWYRARWRNEVSAPARLMVRAKAILETISLPSGRAFKATPIEGAPKAPILQRLNRSLGKWERVRVLKKNKYGVYVFRYARHGDQIRVWVRGDRCWVPGPSVVLTT
jgi:hypothetical protein